MALGQHVQTADFKAEKHAPVIETPSSASVGEIFDITVSVGKEIAHPNTTEHFIGWISVYFKPADGKFVHNLGRFEFTAHGESVTGPNTGPVYTEPFASFKMKAETSGTIHAVSYCNIHGLWESEAGLTVG